jgi:peptidoglycan/LPS O-acetylase OafA/YrhL
VGEESAIANLRAATLRLFIPGEARTDRLALLDTVRAFAVLAVVVHHVWAVAGQPPLPIDLGVHTLALGGALQGAGLGVDIFFVLSGFLLSMPWHRAAIGEGQAPSLPRYAVRRFLRIVPPYWFMLMVMLLLMSGATIPWTAVSGPDGIKAIIAHIFFVQYLFPSTSGGFAGVNGSVWTLTIEMLFYVTLPVLIYGFVKERWRFGLPIAIGFSLFWVWLSWHHLGALVDHLLAGVDQYGVTEDGIRYFLATQYLAFIGEFAIGIVVAGWWIRRRRGLPPSSRTRWLAGAGAVLALLCALALMYGFGNHNDSEWLRIFGRMGVAASVGLMIMGFLAGPQALRRPLTFLPFRLYGVIGYSVFLWHLPLLTVMANWPIFAEISSGSERFWNLLVVGLPVTTIFGVVLYLLVERPFLIARPGPLKKIPRPKPIEGVPQPVTDPEAW